MNYSNSFMYVISSEERTNTDVVASYYDFVFGGFSEPYDDYHVEVISLAAVAGLPQASNFIVFVAENLASDGYFCTNKLLNREAVLYIIPLNAVQDAYIQSDAGASTFTVKNCRIPRQVRFRFLKPDLTPAISGVDVNSGAETKWLLKLRLTPK